MNGAFFRNDNIQGLPNYNDFLNTSNNSGVSSNSNPTLTGPLNNLNGFSNTGYNSNSSSYAQNVLKSNVGISGYFFVSFPDSVDWRDKIFYGVLAEAGDDYILVYNEDNQEYYLIWSIYLNYATFDQKPNISKE